MNQTVLVGRIVREMELRHISKNHRVINNMLAVSRNHRNRNGEVETDFIPIVAWDHLADLLANYVKKGEQVSVSGRMQSRSYTDANQQTVYVVELLVREITLLNNGRSFEQPEKPASPSIEELKEAMNVPMEHLATDE